MLEIAGLADRYQMMTRAHDNGARDGNRNQPSKDAVSFSETETEIIQVAQDDINKFEVEQKTFDDKVREAVRSIRSDLARSVLFNVETFQTRAEIKFVEFERELVRLHERLLTAQRDFRYFKTFHRLDREAEPASTAFDVFSLLVFFIASDGVLNAYFFMDSNPYGLVGGMLMAAIISFANTGLGFGAGLLPWRYLLHRNRLHRLWAFPLLVAALVAILLLNFAVGHYRELLMASRDAEIPQILEPMLHSTFVLQTLQSYILTGSGIFIAMLCAYKGFTMFDPYPGFGKRFKRLEDARDAYEAKVKEIQRQVSSIAAAYLKEMGKTFGDANSKIEECLGELDEAATRSSNFEIGVKGIEDACNAAIKIYRKANIQVRDNIRQPAPGYFIRDVILEKPTAAISADEFVRAKKDIELMQEKSRQAFEEITQQVRAIERQLVSESALNERLERVRNLAQKAQMESAPAGHVEAFSRA